ncbi:hypothetical protein MPH_12141 [Macrophomina phaseolina MS6]|uniref:Uncharacterized protein n=1 Tax=Macrophomina phaseolina (strain MS6) TaxID=1126212 RepID=K2R8N7_MACPH|nr:hypothetical protein MPH_12141 [Macrophomina phaseolina MS6]
MISQGRCEYSVVWSESLQRNQEPRRSLQPRKMLYSNSTMAKAMDRRKPCVDSVHRSTIVLLSYSVSNYAFLLILILIFFFSLLESIFRLQQLEPDARLPELANKLLESVI